MVGQSVPLVIRINKYSAAVYTGPKLLDLFVNILFSAKYVGLMMETPDVSSKSCSSVYTICVKPSSSKLLVVVRRCREQLCIVILSSVIISLCLSKASNQ